MSTDDRIATTPNPEEKFNNLLTYAELLNTPRLARLYAYILRNGPVEIKVIKTDLFDGVIDFDAAIRDPNQPDQMLPRYDSGDHLHPNDAGY